MKNTQIFSLALLLSLVIATPAFITAKDVVNTIEIDVVEIEIDVVENEESEKTNWFDISGKLSSAKDCCGEKIKAFVKFAWTNGKINKAVTVTTVAVAAAGIVEAYNKAISKAFKQYVLGQEVIDEDDFEAEFKAMLKAAELEETEEQGQA